MCCSYAEDKIADDDETCFQLQVPASDGNVNVNGQKEEAAAKREDYSKQQQLGAEYWSGRNYYGVKAAHDS